METQTQWVATSDQQRLAVRTFGDISKPALVLVHGYPAVKVLRFTMVA